LEKIFSSLHIHIAYLDPEFRFIRVNDAYADSAGNDKDFFVGKNHFDLFPDEENEKIFRQVVESGKAFTAYARPFEYPDRPEAGVTYWDWNLQPLKDTKGKVEGLILSLIDVSAREKALGDYGRLMAAIENAYERFFIIDNRNIIRYVNPAFLRSRGLKKEDLIGKKSDAFLIDQYNEHIYKDIHGAIKKGLVWNGLYRKKLEKGIYNDLSITAYPIKDDKGIISDYTVLERDTTEEMKAQKEIRQKYKMEALGTLAGGIAHDFNNILMPIIVNIEVVLRNMAEKNPLRDNLKLSLDAANRGRELVQQIISYSRPAPRKKEPVKIFPVVEEVLQFLKSTLPSNIKIKLDIGSKTSSVMADPTQIFQVLINLCKNSEDALGEKGGEICVKLENVQLEDASRESVWDPKKKEYIKLAVSDTGCGMGPKVMDKIFDPFFSLKNKGNRSGMGLAVVHGIVKDHGGFINVDSTEGEGTVFELFFPRVEMGDHDSEEEDVRLPYGNEHILLIDDDLTILQSLRNILESLGYEITTKTDGKAALELFRSHPESFDLIITDQIMPEILGSDLSKEVLSTRPDIPIILFTGYDDKIDVEKAKEIGIQEFLFKPLNTHEIAQAVRRALNK